MRIAALIAAILTIPLSFAFDLVFPGMAFMDRVGITFLILCGIIIMISLLERKGTSEKAIPIERSLFHTGAVFNVSAILVMAVLVVIYLAFW